MATRIPISKDSFMFEDRQKRIWEDMERGMERRRREWEDEIDKMRKEFFYMRPDKSDLSKFEGGSTLTRTPIRMSGGRSSTEDDGKAIIEKDDIGQPVFKVRFNMKEYKPEEVNVKMDATRIMVSARHEAKELGSTVSREYSREVNIPREVDPLALQCVLTVEGILVVHAPIPAPMYSTLKSSSTAAPSPPSASRTSSSYQTSATASPRQPAANPSSSSAVSEQQQEQQVLTHTINQQQTPLSSARPPATFPVSSQSQVEEASNLQDHVTPSFKPPPDVNKTSGVLENIQPQSTNQSKFSSSSSVQNSTFTPQTFGTRNFPVGFPESSRQAQLSAPKVTSHDGKFQLTMPIEDYRPEDLTVKTQDNKVIICAKREITTANTSRTTEMSREHSLPGNVDPLTVKAFFTDTNDLIIEAPFL